MNLFNLFGGGLDKGLEEYRAAAKNALLLDVRTPEEFSEGHVPGSVNVPLDRIHTLEADKAIPLFVYCHSGARSGQACAWLTRSGYTARNIGGMMSYHGPVEKGRKKA